MKANVNHRALSLAAFVRRFRRLRTLNKSCFVAASRWFSVCRVGQNSQIRAIAQHALPTCHSARRQSAEGRHNHSRRGAKGVSAALCVNAATSYQVRAELHAGGTTLTPESQAQLPKILEDATNRSGADLVVTGHTDSTGALAANDALSLSRAKVVSQFWSIKAQ